MMTNENDELLAALEARGCEVEHADGAVFVSLPGEDGEFVFDRYGDTLYLGATFMTPEEIAESAYAARLDRFLLELQDRNLGCHFSYDKGGYLSVGAELNPAQQTADDLLQHMEQIAYVIEACISLCDRVLETGEVPSDQEVDAALGVSQKLH